MENFELKQPGSLSDATAMMHGDETLALAGGMTLLPSMKQRLISCETLVDLGGIDEITSIKMEGDQLVIGAMCTHAAVAANALVQSKIPGLAGLASHIGDQQVRHRGTIGGSISNNDPAADYPSALVALRAVVVTTDRELPAEQFFTGLFETALEPGELVTAVRFDVPDASAYGKFPSPASRYAMAGAYVAKFSDEVRVAITGAAPCVFRATEMEHALGENFSPDALDSVSIEPDELLSDMHADANYRANLAVLMAQRATTKALGG